MAASLRVTQVKSTISHIARTRATIRALGLHRIGDIVTVPDNDATRGMVRAVRFLVTVQEVEGEARRGTRRSNKTARAATARASTKTPAATKTASKKPARTGTSKAARTGTAKAAGAGSTKAGTERKASRPAARAKSKDLKAAEEDK